MRPELVSIDDLAKTLAVSVSTIRTWLKDGAIPRQTYIRVGNTYRFELEEVISALKQTSTRENEKKLPESFQDLDQSTIDAMRKAGFKFHDDFHQDSTEHSSYQSEDERPETSYLKAAEAGDTNAQFFLAHLYADGNFNVEYSPEKSWYWYERAAEQGHSEAIKICEQAGRNFKIQNKNYWLKWLKDNEINLVEVRPSLLEEKASTNLKSDKSFLCDAIAISGSVFEFADETLKEDLDVISASRSFWLRWIESTDYWNDGGLTFPNYFPETKDEGAPLHLKNDRDFIFKAIELSASFYLFASKEIQSDDEIIRKALSKDPSLIFDIPKRCFNDEDLIISVIENTVYLNSITENGNWVSDFGIEGLLGLLRETNLMDDKSFVMRVLGIKGCGVAILYSNPKLRADRDVALKAVEDDLSNLLYVDPILAEDEVLIKLAATTPGGQEALNKVY